MTEQHIMIDLETLGTGVESVFISIGMVTFDIETGKQSGSFYKNVDWQSSIDNGRKMDADTVKWWLSQSDSARKAVIKEGVKLRDALVLLDAYIHRAARKGKVFVWSNGSTFDISMLEHAYSSLGIKIPWAFYSVRDVRTIKYLGKHLVDKNVFKMEGMAHNALEDAKHQAKYVSILYNALHGNV